MSPASGGEDGVLDPGALRAALTRIAARAGELDERPRFPQESIADLARVGALELPAAVGHSPLRLEVQLVRAVARADASTARIFDGHLNGVQRLGLLGPPGLREAEIAAVARGELVLGVWGADPAHGEGEPAAVARGPGGAMVLRGVKTFCSGAGGVQRALVVVRGEDGEGRRLAYVDTGVGVEIDRSWYRASGLRASESHRVRFRDTPVLALLGGPDELTRQPWFALDAVRSAATWSGIADAIADRLSEAMGAADPDEHQLGAVGRVRVARGTVDRWLQHATAILDACRERVADGDTADPETADPDDPMADPGRLAIECRAAIEQACRAIALDAARACGSRALVGAGGLDRSLRDLELFLLQHRLEPRLAELGRATLEQATAPRRTPPERFERLYESDSDPWSYDSSEYERAKYAATLAALDGRRFGDALEVGCSIGAFTELLASRCERVRAIDFSRRAVGLARARLDALGHVRVQLASFPEQAPEGGWDLVVCSEVLYYLDRAALQQAVQWLRGRLLDGATVLAVDWRGPTRTEPHDGDQVHDLLQAWLEPWHTLESRQPGYRLDRFDGSGGKADA